MRTPVERIAFLGASLVLIASTVVLVARPQKSGAELPSAPFEAVQPLSTAEPNTPVAVGGRTAGGGATRYQTSSECPEMDNPGGLEWKPKSDAGPFPTNGSVHVPDIGVAAPIVKVGVGRDGTMVVPHNARDVAWLDQGPLPGKTNNIVLAGHINYSRVAGSFSRLREVSKGDRITVEMDKKHHKFRVVWNCYFDRNTAHAEQIMGKTHVPSVTLISCGGVFDRGAGTHSQRIAVRAEAITSESASNVDEPLEASPTPGAGPDDDVEPPDPLPDELLSPSPGI